MNLQLHLFQYAGVGYWVRWDGVFLDNTNQFKGEDTEGATDRPYGSKSSNNVA